MIIWNMLSKLFRKEILYPGYNKDLFWTKRTFSRQICQKVLIWNIFVKDNPSKLFVPPRFIITLSHYFNNVLIIGAWVFESTKHVISESDHRVIRMVGWMAFIIYNALFDRAWLNDVEVLISVFTFHLMSLQKFLSWYDNCKYSIK